jgi:predicted lipid-binding transport protein (Tim44 family)
VEDPTTNALNLTFFGTVAVAFVQFLGLFAAFVVTLVLAGVGRLVAVVVMAFAGSRGKGAGRQQPRSAKSAKAVRPAKKEPALSPEWAAAVARADARAAAKSKAEAAPAVKVSVRDLPSPAAPAQDVKEVAPLVESAMDQNGTANAAARAFKKPSLPAAKALLDTGSLVGLSGRIPPAKDKNQASERKAG